jgi:hypothetical protein
MFVLESQPAPKNLLIQLLRAEIRVVANVAFPYLVHAKRIGILNNYARKFPTFCSNLGKEAILRL